ncbi:MAG: AI-2E family transporter [Patescibacteria group bacterium]
MAAKSKKTSKKSVASVTRVNKNEGLFLPNLSRYFLLAAVFVAAFFIVWVISPFFTVLVFAILIAIVFQPINRFFITRFNNIRTGGALLTTLIVLIVFLVPLSLFGVFIAREAVSAFTVLNEQLESMELERGDFISFDNLPLIGDKARVFQDRYQVDEFLENINVDLATVIEDLGDKASDFIVNQSTIFLKSLGNIFVGLFVLIITVFFLFRDGDRFRAYLKKMSPLPHKYEDEIEVKLKETTYGLVVGTFGTGIIQGVVGGIGFAIAGLEHAVFYATLMAFASLVPFVGSSIVWGTTALGMIIQGDTTWGIFLMVWGLVVISNIDNITRPFLIGTSTKMHPLAVFFVVVGGLFVFGPKGIVFGPLILSFALSIFHIYQLEYRETLDR